MNRSAAAAAGMLALLLLAGCGSSGASSGSPVATLSLTPSTAAEATPTSTASASSDAGELGALIPNTIGNITLQKQSMSGDQFVGSGTATQEAQDFLDGLGVSTDDVTVAVGFGVDPGSGSVFAELLFRAQGASSDRLMSLFMEAADRQQETPLQWQSVQIGGKTVEKATTTQQGAGTVYLYASGDLLAYIGAASDDQAAEALAALP